MRSLLKELSLGERASLSEQASQQLVACSLWQEARHVCLFVSYGVEIETRFLLMTAWNQEKNVYLPKCWPHEPGSMDFFLCKGYGELRSGQFGILEPSEEIAVQERALKSFAPPDLILVPGLAFTPGGLRLGKGGGYYDRFMAKEICRNSTRIGFAFGLQVVESLPAEPWDLALHYLCTETGCAKTR